jgi:hypothetical protein
MPITDRVKPLVALTLGLPVPWIVAAQPCVVVPLVQYAVMTPQSKAIEIELAKEPL